MMKVEERQASLSRRALLGRGTAIGALLVVSGPAVLGATEAWGLESKGLAPSTLATLIQVARDIYPHDQVPTKFYALAVKADDEKAAKDPAHKAMIEKGIADLDRRAGPGGYAGLGWEEERVKLLQAIEKTPFFQSLRSALVVSLYNQKDVWPIFGYEGESYSKGGYVSRGFDDIEWL